MTDDEPIPPPKRRVWLIVLLAVGIPVLCGLVCCGGLGIWGFNMGKGLLEAKNSADVFLNDLAGKRVDEAYQNTSNGFKKATSLEAFRTFIGKNPALTSGSNPQVVGMQMLQQSGPKKALIKENVTGGGNSAACSITLVREGDVWKVDGFTVP